MLLCTILQYDTEYKKYTSLHSSKENAATIQFQTSHSRNFHSLDTFISRAGPRERRPTYEKEGLPFQFGAIYEAVGRLHVEPRRTEVIQTDAGPI